MKLDELAQEINETVLMAESQFDGVATIQFMKSTLDEKEQIRQETAQQILNIIEMSILKDRFIADDFAKHLAELIKQRYNLWTTKTQSVYFDFWS